MTVRNRLSNERTVHAWRRVLRRLQRETLGRLRVLASEWLPPVLVRLYRHASGGAIRFRGRFTDWQSARARASGYDQQAILGTVSEAMRAVLRGEATCERDGFLFSREQFPYPLIALLLRAASENDGSLNVLDFGGALGSSYYQCRGFLAGLRKLNWCVVEQDDFVARGQEEFATPVLHFCSSVTAAADRFPPQVVLASSVLQYLPSPEEAVAALVATNANYIVIDRTPVARRGKETITVQIVGEPLVTSSYPVRFFDTRQLTSWLGGRYVEIDCFAAVDGTLGFGDLQAEFKGWIFARKDIGAEQF